MIEERFGVGPGIVVGVQAKPIENITDLFVLGVRVLKTNIAEERHVVVSFQVESDLFELQMVFRDETLSAKDFLGKTKKKNEETVG